MVLVSEIGILFSMKTEKGFCQLKNPIVTFLRKKMEYQKCANLSYSSKFYFRR